MKSKNHKFKTHGIVLAGILSAVLLYACTRQVVKTKEYFEHVPVLCYHYVSPADYLNNNYINTPPNEFEDQLKFLHSSGYRTVLSKDIPVLLAPAEKNILGDEKKPVIISFDDGYESVHRYAFPLMKKYGYKGILFLITDKIENDNTGMYMKKEQIAELLNAGWEIGSHTVTHPRLNCLSIKEITEEVVHSKTALESMFGTKVVSFAYPYGLFNKKVLSIVKDNYKYAYSTIQGNNYGFNDPHLVERYLVLKSDTMANYKMNIVSKKLDCHIHSELVNNILYVDVSFPGERADSPLQVYFNDRLIRDLPPVKNSWQFQFNYYREFNNFSLVMKDDNGDQCSVTKMIHISKSADVY